MASLDPVVGRVCGPLTIQVYTMSRGLTCCTNLCCVVYTMSRGLTCCTNLCCVAITNSPDLVGATSLHHLLLLYSRYRS